jgi:hypothetical protein
MALANAVQGARHTPQVITWTDGDGDALNLTGATLTGRVIDLGTETARNVDGVLSVIDPATGSFQWAYGALDVGTAGRFSVQFTATFGAAGADRTLLEPWEVERAI